MAADDLAHVRWLGGGSGAGKTTIASILADEFGLAVYSTDAQLAAHGAEPGADAPLLDRFREMNMDERWLDRDPRTMLQTFPWFLGERFDRIVRDLRGTNHVPLTVAEGFRLLPRLVQPLLAAPWHAVWLIPTPAFRRAAFLQRPAAEQFWLRTSDPERAFELLLERDAMFADAVVRDARQLDLKVIRVDESRTAADVAGEVAHWLRLR